MRVDEKNQVECSGTTIYQDGIKPDTIKAYSIQEKL